MCLPSRAYQPLTVTSSPALTMLRFQPYLFNAPGLPSSTVQRSAFPLSALPSTVRNACGFVQLTLVTFPSRRAGLFESYSAAKGWCAQALAPMSRAPAAINDVRNLLIGPSLTSGRVQGVFLTPRPTAEQRG